MRPVGGRWNTRAGFEATVRETYAGRAALRTPRVPAVAGRTDLPPLFRRAAPLAGGPWQEAASAGAAGGDPRTLDA